MSDEAGDPRAADELLPLVYDELRKFAAIQLVKEQAGQTLQPTALVHEAYVRLVGGANSDQWNSRGHFFAAAALAIQRVLIDNARRKRSLKRGGEFVRRELDELAHLLPEPQEDVLVLTEALQKFETVDPRAAKLVHLRYFVGVTLSDAAEMLNISPRAARRLWTYARAWLRQEIKATDAPAENF